MSKEKFDFICSLGGNCAAAHNLLIRGLRDAAYPFDWTYFNSDEAVFAMADNFKNGFKNYMLKENMTELPVNPSHADRIQYEDGCGKIVWANHFSYKKDRDKDYIQVKKKFDRRFKRMINRIKKSDKIFFLFCTSFYVKEDAFKYLSNTLEELFPNKEFKIKVASFNSEKDEILNDGNVEILYFRREMNLYDYDKTNLEWSFLDDIKINKSILKEDFIKISPLKKGIMINILPALFRIINIRLYLFGFRLCFSIGENKSI